MILTKVFVVAVALVIASVFARQIGGWFRANADIVREAAAVSFVWGIASWLCYYALFELGEWFSPGIFGREPSGIKTLAACGLSAGLAVWAVRKLDAKKDTRSPEVRAKEGRELIAYLQESSREAELRLKELQRQ